MKKHKIIFFFTLMFLCFLLLTGCEGRTTMKSVSEPVKEVKEKPNLYEDTLDIGTIFYEYNNGRYIYSGMVNDAILITILKEAGTNYSYSVPIYIPILRKSEVDLPYTDATIKIKEVNKEDGKIKLLLKE